MTPRQYRRAAYALQLRYDAAGIRMKHASRRNHPQDLAYASIDWYDIEYQSMRLFDAYSTTTSEGADRE